MNIHKSKCILVKESTTVRMIITTIYLVTSISLPTRLNTERSDFQRVSFTSFFLRLFFMCHCLCLIVFFSRRKPCRMLLIFFPDFGLSQTIWNLSLFCSSYMRVDRFIRNCDDACLLGIWLIKQTDLNKPG